MIELDIARGELLHAFFYSKSYMIHLSLSGHVYFFGYKSSASNLNSKIKGTQHAAYHSYVSKIFKLKETIEIQLVRPTGVCGKV